MTPQDRERDLAADLATCERFPPEGCPWESHTFGYEACLGWPAAIRRAMAAEALLRRLVAAERRLSDEDDFSIEAYDQETWVIAKEARALLEGKP